MNENEESQPQLHDLFGLTGQYHWQIFGQMKFVPTLSAVFASIAVFLPPAWMFRVSAAWVLYFVLAHITLCLKVIAPAVFCYRMYDLTNDNGR